MSELAFLDTPKAHALEAAECALGMSFSPETSSFVLPNVVSECCGCGKTETCVQGCVPVFVLCAAVPEVVVRVPLSVLHGRAAQHLVGLLGVCETLTC